MQSPHLREIVALARALRDTAAAVRHRYLLALSGSTKWGRDSAQALIDGLAPRRWIWLGLSHGAPESAEPARTALEHLGEEADLVVFDAHCGFDPDAFAAAAGILTGGGLLILVLPALDLWPFATDPENERLAVYPFTPSQVTGRFVARMARVLGTHHGVYEVREGMAIPSVVPRPPALHSASSPVGDPDCRSRDQEDAVAAVMHTAAGHRRRPAVLIADRGRGKSAALGIAAARLLTSGTRHIVVTGPRRAAVDMVFRHAGRVSGTDAGQGSVLGIGNAQVSFLAPDALLAEDPRADLVLVDEAAALPTALLERLLHRFPRIVFATTVHGYEGTGRGFAVRFRPLLDRVTPRWREVRLETPIRWGPGDPLEDLVFRSLLLDAESLPDEKINAVISEDRVGAYGIEQLDREDLATDEPLLDQVFGLLVSAHYRTTPLDLRHLLDGPNLEVWTARAGDMVLATMLVAKEGGFEIDLAKEIWAGRRRPRGHLIPQTLAAHVGLRDGPSLKGSRIIRIAVHPAVRRRGIATAMVRRLREHAGKEGLDFIGASFAATADLLRFWCRAGLVPIRVGTKRETTSGAHAILVLDGVGEPGRCLRDRARERFLMDFPVLVGHELKELEPQLVDLLLDGVSLPSGDEWKDYDLSLIQGFARDQRPFEPTRPALRRLMLRTPNSRDEPEALTPEERDALILAVLQARPWDEVARCVGATGRAEVIAIMRRAAGAILDACSDSNSLQ